MRNEDQAQSDTPLHIICERDVGLFSLIQQVIANIPWALQSGRVPVALFGERCCYWTPFGYRGRENVWEYYFDPIENEYPSSSIDSRLLNSIEEHFPQWNELGIEVDGSWITAHFGDYPDLCGLTLSIPYLWDDPDTELRRSTSEIVTRYVRPRTYILEKVESFWSVELSGSYVIGVHIRGTDATSYYARRAHRIGSLSLRQYMKTLRGLISKIPDAKIFVASDDEKSVLFLKKRFGDRVIAYDSLRHDGGQVTGFGPEGGTMPGYISGDRDFAARNGEEAVIDYLLLGRCNILVHNSSGLARTVLLANADIPHINTHLNRKILIPILRYLEGRLLAYRRWRYREDLAG